ncbi:hypothetical protein [Amycolatopsis sp. FU40]|uniref:hypothetical protein n=1 Tax=Amycolatopsis sp. FU40 TaxID=2914159 RepID=UPI00351D4327
MTNSPGAPGPGDDTPTPSRGFASPDPGASAATPPQTGETDNPSGAGTSSSAGENAASTGTNPPAGTNRAGADPSAASENPAGSAPQPGGESPAGATSPSASENSAGATSRPSGESAVGETPAGDNPATSQPGWASPAGAGSESSSGVPSSSGAVPPPPAGSGQWQSPGQQPIPPYPGTPYGRPGQGWNPNGLGKPGVIALRPLNVGDILDGAITAIRRYPLLILGVSAVVAVVAAGLNLVASLWLVPDFNRVTQLGPAATQQQQLDALYSLLGSTLTALLPVLVISMLAQTFLTGFLTVVMGKAVLGRPVDFGSAMREAAPRLLPLLAVTILYTLATIVAAAFCLIPAVLPYVFWSLAGPALVLERGTIGQAFTRSRQLVSGMFWRVFGILLLAGVISWLISAIISVPFSLGSGAFSGIFDPQATLPKVTTGSLVLQSVGKVIAETIVMPFTALVTVVLYIDQRMRREGMDIELARAAGIQPPQPPQQAW